MHAAEDYLRTREEARQPQPIWSAQAVGVCTILLGIAMVGLNWIAPIEFSILASIGLTLVPMGAALLILGRKGGARHRVTETTRYPQQTGEIADMFFQTVGENYLWVVVASMIVWLILVAIEM